MENQNKPNAIDLVLSEGKHEVPSQPPLSERGSSGASVELRNKIKDMYVTERRTMSEIAQSLRTTYDMVASVVRENKYQELRQEIIKLEGEQLIEQSRQVLIRGFNDTITVASEIVHHYRQQMMAVKKKNAGHLDEFIKDFKQADMDRVTGASNTLHKHLKLMLEQEMAKKPERIAASTDRKIVVEFSEGYTPELIEDQRFQVQEEVNRMQENKNPPPPETVKFYDNLDTAQVKEEPIDVEIENKD